MEDLWDSIARSNAILPIPQWQKDELTRRKQNFVQNQPPAQTWDEIKQSILKRNDGTAHFSF